MSPDTDEDGMERSITVTVGDFEDARRAGKMTANELYSRFLDGESDTFELTVRSVDTDTDQEGRAMSPDTDVADTDQWPYCPNCGAELEEPAGPYHEWTDCPNCGEVCIEFYAARGDQ